MQNFYFTQSCSEIALLSALFRCCLLCSRLLGRGLLRRRLGGRLLICSLRRPRRSLIRHHRRQAATCLLFSNRHNDVSQPALIAERAAHRGRPNPLHARSLVRHSRLHIQVVDVHVETLLLREIVRVLDRRTQDLLYHRSDALRAEVNRVDRLLHALALDEVQDELRLLRARALELCLSAKLSDFFCCLCHDSQSLETKPNSIC